MMSKKMTWPRRILLAAAGLLLAAAVIYLLLVNMPYHYPSLGEPGSLNHLEKLEALQAPEWRLKLMSTDALIESAITYPLAGDMLAWDTWAAGYSAVAGWSNVFQCLESREDAPQRLIRFYQNYRISRYRDGLTENSEKLFYLEIILLQDIFWDELSGEEKLEVRDIAYQKYLEKLDKGYPEGAAREFYTTANRLGKDFPRPTGSPPDTPEE